MISNKKRILVTAGEPASISSEISIKAFSNKINNENYELILITDPILIEDALKRLGEKVKLNVLKKLNNFSDYKKNHINVLPTKLIKKSIPGQLNVENSKFVKNSIDEAVKLIQKNQADAIVTNPINKFIMKEANFKFNGHTEYLGYLSKIKKNPIMMLESSHLKVVPLTTHVPLKLVSKKLNYDTIIRKISILNEQLINLYNIKKPKIFVSGLNPHSGDNGKIGIEEVNLINPAINELKKMNINVNGPIPGDTLFQTEVRKLYDVGVCMYHDQALIPIKALYSRNIINVTLGLDFVRTSPDHGTAIDIAGKNIANPKSLILAIKKALYLANAKKK